MPATFEYRLAQNWGWFVLRSFICLAFFLVVALVKPFDSMTSLTHFVGVFLLFNGLSMGIEGALAADRHNPWGWETAAGLLTMLMGTFSLFESGHSLHLIMTWWAGWAFLTGAMEVICGVRLQTEDNEWLFILGGLLTMSFGFTIGALPGLALEYLNWTFAIYALAYAATMAGLAFHLYRRRSGVPLEPLSEQPPVDNAAAGTMVSVSAQAPR